MSLQYLLFYRSSFIPEIPKKMSSARATLSNPAHIPPTGDTEHILDEQTFSFST